MPVSRISIISSNSSAPLPVKRVEQKEDQWCTAACGEMIAAYLGISHVRQCDIVNRYNNGGPDACADPDAADVGCAYMFVEAVYRSFGIGCSFVGNGPLSPNQVESEINSSRPIVTLLQYYEGPGAASVVAYHVVVLSGIAAGGSIYVIDPFQGQGEGYRPYQSLVSAGGQGHWLGSWVDIFKL